MDEMVEYTSEIVEFKPKILREKQIKCFDICTGTDSMPVSANVSVETNRKRHVHTQTTEFEAINVIFNEIKLSKWLRKILHIIEAELIRGPPLYNEVVGLKSASFGGGTFIDDFKIQTYQKLTLNAQENYHALAVWLSVHTYNAPVLVISSAAQHDDWCEHVEQCLHIFIPKRAQTGNFVIYTEIKRVPVKACLKNLTTNTYNKDIFAGSTINGDIFVWKYFKKSIKNDSVEVEELFNISTPHGFATAMDWCTDTCLLSCYSNGWVIRWLIVKGKHMVKDGEYLLKAPQSCTNEITTMVALNLDDFMVGTKDGGVYHCRNIATSDLNVKKQQIGILPFKKHRFMVSSLLKTKISGDTFVVSCDLSGQIYYHDIDNADDNVIGNINVQIPLPFKNVFALARDSNDIYCPGIDGGLECYRNGVQSTIKGDLQGKGSLIKSSDNRYWIITGLYEYQLQIFYVKD